MIPKRIWFLDMLLRPHADNGDGHLVSEQRVVIASQ
jgi:hypothetical protein